MNVTGMYFSPCGQVRRTVGTMANRAAGALGTTPSYVDFTRPEARERDYRFGPSDVVFFGTPVYAGRVPNRIAPFIDSRIQGNGAAAVPVVCFGNRAFDDALSELALLLRRHGFLILAGAAVVSEHSFDKRLAAGRPTEADLAEIGDFAVKAIDKIQTSGASWVLPASRIPGAAEPSVYYTPLGTDGQPAKFLKAVPAVDQARCVRCSRCAGLCPMGSIDPADVTRMTGICIKCHACIHGCPMGARTFTDAAFLSHRAMLVETYRRPASSVFIL